MTVLDVLLFQAYRVLEGAVAIAKTELACEAGMNEGFFLFNAIIQTLERPPRIDGVVFVKGGGKSFLLTTPGEGSGVRYPSCLVLVNMLPITHDINYTKMARPAKDRAIRYFGVSESIQGGAKFSECRVSGNR